MDPMQNLTLDHLVK